MRTYEAFLKLLFVATLSVGGAFAQHQIAATGNDMVGTIPVNGWIPRWRNAWLVGCEGCQGSPLLYLVDRAGRRETVALDVAAAASTTVWDVAVGADASIAAVGRSISGNSREGTFLVWISPDRSRQVVTRVWPYIPHVAAVAADGSIWTVGAVVNDSYRLVYPNVLRHYTPAGKLLTSTIVTRLRTNTGGAFTVNEASTLMVSSDRIGWLTFACQYLEFSLDGVEMGRYTCPSGYTSISQLGGVALSPSADLVVSAKPAAPLAPLELDRSTGQWKPVTILNDSGNTNELLGFDGFTLITRAGLTLRRYAWSGQAISGGHE
jgi:hypothetical protein